MLLLLQTAFLMWLRRCSSSSDNIRPPPPDGSPLTAPDGVPPPPPPNDLPLVASDDLHLSYIHLFDFDQKWRRMRKDDPKLSILLSGPSRLAYEMLGLGGIPDGVPLAALEGVSLVAPNGVLLAAPVSVSLAAPDDVTRPPNGFPLVAPVGVPPPPHDIRPPPPDDSPLTAPDGVPPHPPPNDLPLVASDDLHLRCSLVSPVGVPLAAPVSVYLAVPNGVTPPPNDFPLVALQKWRRMHKDDPKLSILLSGPSRLADEMLGLGGTPAGVPLAALEVFLLRLPTMLLLLQTAFLMWLVGVPPPPDNIRPPPPDGSPLTAPDGVPPPPPPNDLPLVASDDLHLSYIHLFDFDVEPMEI
ncbi:uncharacterized protein LOC127078736 [Lathyrus oleraceus]|uniref:uncharacterized protein LOC127078736 n=1 Tax=Pisum sativum TaxID=3888 RepID=UPI0021D2CE4D|nr:uncharacterized protein LOC127078736 [Pisum sativum]